MLIECDKIVLDCSRTHIRNDQNMKRDWAMDIMNVHQDCDQLVSYEHEHFG